MVNVNQSFYSDIDSAAFTQTNDLHGYVIIMVSMVFIAKKNLNSSSNVITF